MSGPKNEIDQGIAKALKVGKRGRQQATLDSSGKPMSYTHIYPCFCLNRGLMDERERCPAHGSPIGTHKARTQNLGLRR